MKMPGWLTYSQLCDRSVVRREEIVYIFDDSINIRSGFIDDETIKFDSAPTNLQVYLL